MARRNQQVIEMKNFDGIHSFPRRWNSDPQASVSGPIRNPGFSSDDVEGTIGPNGLEQLNNLNILANGHLVSRAGSVPLSGVGAYGASGIKRMFATPTLPAADPVVMNFNGNVYIGPTAFNALNATAGSDLAILVIGNRLYFSITTGGPDYIYVWDAAAPATPARAAAGAKPTGTFTIAVSGTAGNIENGQHIYAVAYETSTGFITPPNLYVSVTTFNHLRTDLTAIPLGPAGTVARHILMSRVLRNWDGNLTHPELFFALRIGDNTTAALVAGNALNKYDTDLQNSADYLKDVTEHLLRANAMCLFSGRVCWVGDGDGPVRLSQPGDYETFLGTDGFLKAYPLQPTAPTYNCAELAGVLYLFREDATYGTQDNGDSPSRWPVSTLDSSRGCSALGIARTDGGGHIIEGGLLILDHDGLYYFDGRYSNLPLTHKVGGLIQDMLIAYQGLDGRPLSNWSVAVDTSRKLIYFHCGAATDPLNGNTPLYTEPANYQLPEILVGEYTNGGATSVLQQRLTWEGIRWSTYNFYNYVQAMCITTPNDNTAIYPSNLHIPVLYIGMGFRTGAVQGRVSAIYMTEQGGGTQIDLDMTGTQRSTPWWIQSGSLGLSNTGGVTLLEAVGWRAGCLNLKHGAPFGAIDNTVQVAVKTVSDNNPFTALATTLKAATVVSEPTLRIMYDMVQCLFKDERFRIRIKGWSNGSGLANATVGFRIASILAFVTPFEEELPR